MLSIETNAIGYYRVSGDYNGIVTSEIVADMVDWIADCEWGECDFDVRGLSDVAIIRGVHRHYDGGIGQFLRDSLSEILS